MCNVRGARSAVAVIIHRRSERRGAGSNERQTKRAGQRNGEIQRNRFGLIYHLIRAAAEAAR